MDAQRRHSAPAPSAVGSEQSKPASGYRATRREPKPNRLPKHQLDHPRFVSSSLRLRRHLTNRKLYPDNLTAPYFLIVILIFVFNKGTDMSTCQRKLLAKRGCYQFESCSCGTVHFSIGPITVHLNAEGFEDLKDLLWELKSNEEVALPENEGPILWGPAIRGEA